MTNLSRFFFFRIGTVPFFPSRSLLNCNSFSPACFQCLLNFTSSTCKLNQSSIMHVACLLTLLICYSLHRPLHHCTIAYLADCGSGFPSHILVTQQVKAQQRFITRSFGFLLFPGDMRSQLNNFYLSYLLTAKQSFETVCIGPSTKF